MKTNRKENVVEEAIVDVLDPMQRVFHAREVVLGREREETEGLVRIER